MRTPVAPDERTRHPTTPVAAATTAVNGDITAAPPPNVATARPPRKRANSGQA